MDDLRLFLNIDEKQDLDSVYHIDINNSFNYKLLNELSNVDSITLGDIEVDSDLEEYINSLVNLNILNIINLNDNINIDNKSINSITIMDSNIDTSFINNLINLEEIHFSNIGDVDLKDISIIRKVRMLIITNCNIINQEYLIELDNIELLDISNSGVKDITPLISNKTLRKIIIDDDIYENNKDYIVEFKNNDIEVLNSNGGEY